MFREPGAARAAGYVLAIAGVLVALGLVLHPVPQGGLDEKPSVLSTTPLWGPIHVAIAFGFVLTVVGGLLALVGGGILTRRWQSALAWASLTVGILFFSGVALVNGYVMHALSIEVGSAAGALVFKAFDDLLLGYGWLGNPLFLFGLTALAFTEVRYRTIALPGWVSLFGLAMALLSWLRGIGSATGVFFLEPFIYANVPAFLWLSYYGYRLAGLGKLAGG
jgi:hypothetical protein